jgi:glutamate-1-semialdehyde 2,1-aminomutase
VMGVIEPGRMAQGGTYCGNSVGAAAAAATLDVLENTDALAQIQRRGTRLMQGMSEILSEAGLEHEITGVPGMFGLTLEPRVRPVVNYRATMESNHLRYELIAGAMRERGVEVEPDWREPLFLCAALSDGDVEETLNVFNDSLKHTLTVTKIAPLP